MAAVREPGHINSERPQGSPESMRTMLFEYVGALHRAYLDQAKHLSPGERAELPLVNAGKEGQITVVVAAARELHILATTSALPAPVGPEVVMADEYLGVKWLVRFFDPSVLPALSTAAAQGDSPAVVRSVLGVADVVYHLSVSLGGGLTGHHAGHAGVALANQHADAARDGDALRHHYRSRSDVVEELLTAQRLGLIYAPRLLAQELLPSLPANALMGTDKELRQALIAAAKPNSPESTPANPPSEVGT